MSGSRRQPALEVRNRRQQAFGRAIVDDICANVVDHPDTWRQRAIEEIALHLDIAGKHP
jgi:hypothetical protein